MVGSPEAQLKVVAHLRDGRLIKGYFSSLPVELDTLKNRPVDMPRLVQLEEEGSGARVEVHAESLKALFFVKSFEGRTNYRELKIRRDRVADWCLECAIAIAQQHTDG